MPMQRKPPQSPRQTPTMSHPLPLKEELSGFAGPCNLRRARSLTQAFRDVSRDKPSRKPAHDPSIPAASPSAGGLAPLPRPWPRLGPWEPPALSAGLQFVKKSRPGEGGRGTGSGAQRWRREGWQPARLPDTGSVSKER